MARSPGARTRLHAAALAGSLLLAGCAAPEIHLLHRFEPQEVRRYALVADVTATLDTGGKLRTERTRLEADARVEVLSARRDEATLRLNIIPRLLRQDGRRVDPPAAQEAEVVLGSDGAVRRVETVGGVSPDVLPDVRDATAILGTPMPDGRVRLGDRWSRTVPAPPGLRDAGKPGEEHARLSALQMGHGYPSAIISVLARRPISRTRFIGGAEVRLSGEETSEVEIAFAFREGLASRLSSIARSTFDVAGVAGRRGTVALRLGVTLTLVSRRLPGRPAGALGTVGSRRAQG